MTGPVLERKAVGLRDLPHIKFQYFARTPKANAFKTVWLPMNASKQVVKDKNQDYLYLYYSRHLLDTSKAPRSESEMLSRHSSSRSGQYRAARQPMRPTTTPDSVKAAMWMTSNNSIAPFVSLGKPTCGYFFSRDTDNKKRMTGIPPTNTVKWRSNNSAN